MAGTFNGFQAGHDNRIKPRTTANMVITDLYIKQIIGRPFILKIRGLFRLAEMRHRLPAEPLYIENGDPIV